MRKSARICVYSDLSDDADVTVVDKVVKLSDQGICK
jgi:hypothetical protein